MRRSKRKRTKRKDGGGGGIGAPSTSGRPEATGPAPRTPHPPFPHDFQRLVQPESSIKQSPPDDAGRDRQGRQALQVDQRTAPAGGDHRRRQARGERGGRRQ